ncbi:MAG: oligosaccharide flippase family protein [Candidatus Solibacter usitatus]|nr:oligosaccharide flippase family protein [Candidatus Solibacter usitatus]
MTPRRQYLLNIAWSSVGAVALILSGLIVAPFLIRQLGAERYGVWTLALSLVDYFWLIDFGVRPATVKLTAEYRALEQWDRLNSLLSTAAAYSLVMGGLILLGFWSSAHIIADFLHIQDPNFPFLLRVVSLIWGMGLVFNTFSAMLEGFQRFDLSNHVFVLYSLLRSIALPVTIYLGYGLREMGYAVLILQIATYAAFLTAAILVYPRMRIGLALVTKETALNIFQYARQMTSSIVSLRLLSAGMPALIAYFLPVRFVTYYTATQKLFEYGMEGIGRVSLIIVPRTSDWLARGKRDAIVYLGYYANSYAAVAWLAMCSFLAVYGTSFFRLWVNDDFATHTETLVIVMAAGQALWPGLTICTAILTGIGKFGVFSNYILLEAVLTLTGAALVLPNLGLPYVAALVGVLLTLNRCLNLARLYCREFQLRPVSFLWRVYAWPVTLASTGVLCLYLTRKLLIPGATWSQLLVVGSIYVTLYVLAAFFLILHPDHRRLVRQFVRKYV